MRFTTDGLIIKEQQVGENDRLVTVLCRDKGIIKAFASGAMRLKGKNTGTSLLSYSSLSLYKSRDTYKINEATVIDLFFSLRSDIEKLTLAQYFCELCLCFAPEEDNAEDFLRVVLNSLSFLEKDKRPMLLIKAVMEMKMGALAGYMPDLEACSKSGKMDGAMFFEPTHGVIYCESCQPPGQLLFLSEGVLAALRHIIYSPLGQLFQFHLPEEGLRVLSEVTEIYVKTHSGYHFKTLEFYHSLFDDQSVETGEEQK
ncbi:MAG: DNA repair protein RecO [Clostridiales bacterium 43-6]|nr:MAG: DNA repair protein RecO [Clostridiales bacterium 43-6]